MTPATAPGKPPSEARLIAPLVSRRALACMLAALAAACASGSQDLCTATSCCIGACEHQNVACVERTNCEAACDNLGRVAGVAYNESLTRLIDCLNRSSCASRFSDNTQCVSEHVPSDTQFVLGAGAATCRASGLAVLLSWAEAPEAFGLTLSSECIDTEDGCWRRSAPRFSDVTSGDFPYLET